MHRVRLFAVVAMLIAAAFALSVHHVPGVLAVSYPAGWNLISGPEGSHVRGATGPLYTLQPGDATYEVLQVTTALKSRYGYWAYFPQGGSLDVGAGGGDTSMNLTDGEWVMAGNPSGTTAATLVGATAAYVYSPAGGYQPATSIAPGQGAWVRGSGLLFLATTGSSPSSAATPVPTASRPAVASPPAATSLSGPAHVAGALSIEGRPAPAGAVVRAFVGDTLCGRQTISEAGHYSLDVAAATATPGCGQADVPVQFSITPPFGTGWRLSSTAAFRPGTAVQRDIAVDLTQLQPEASNVPWTAAQWANTRTIDFSLCYSMSRTASGAAQAAFQQWREASQSLGLRSNLRSDTSGAVCNQDVPGIAIIEDTLSDPNLIAGTLYLDVNGDPCVKNAACSLYTAIIFVNRATFAQTSALDQPNVIAHEIGHALGLGHAAACDGGTIMWADTKCRYPLQHIGVDDIASLNARLGGSALGNAVGSNTQSDGSHVIDGDVVSNYSGAATDDDAAPEPIETAREPLRQFVESGALTFDDWFGDSRHR